jgi:tetratricopeptide (TPR) repeat protein
MHFFSLHTLRSTLLAAAAAGLCLGAAAQMLKDPALEALYSAERNDELQRVSAQRLTTQPDDAQAVLGLALAALSRDDAPARQTAIRHAESCIDKQPRAVPCQYALGVVLGVQAMSEGMFKAARSAGTVRDALVTANELDPAWYPARSALVEFYLHAPGMMGGSNRKAAELARGAPRPEQVRLLEARVAMVERRFDVALQAFATLPPIADPAVAEDARAWDVQCGLAAIAAGQPAQAHFERLVRQNPRLPGAVYGLARARAEAGAHEEAVKLYEQAAALKGAEFWPIAYRLGIAQQALGRHDAAKASYTRFIGAGKGQKSALDDAKKRLEQLAGPQS